MNRKLILIAMLIAILVLQAGCGNEMTVPDKTLEWVITDRVADNELYGECIDYQSKITHSPDKASNTDTVQILLTCNYQHLTVQYLFDATYQYNKSTDLWSIIRGGDWATELTSLDIEKSANAWKQILDAEGWAAEIKTEGIDSVREEDRFKVPLGEIVNDGAVLYAEDLVDYWTLNAQKQYNPEVKMGYLQVVYLSFANPENTRVAYDYYETIWEDALGFNVETSTEKDGFSMLELGSYFQEEGKKAIVIREEGAVFVISAYLENYNIGERDIDSILSKVGCPPKN